MRKINLPENLLRRYYLRDMLSVAQTAIKIGATESVVFLRLRELGVLRGDNGRRPLLWKFLKKVRKTPTCWIWNAGKFSYGYGCFSVDGKDMAASRAAFLLFKGQIPKGLQVLHACDNKLCVNPKHLHLGTHKDNMREMADRRRAAAGEQNGRAKLKEADVKKIIHRHNGGESLRKIHADYRFVSYTAIWQIFKGKSWRHLLKS